jgi:hypothetical protein
MPTAIAHHTEISATNTAPAFLTPMERVKSTSAIGSAMTDVLDALKGLEDRLAEDPRFGAGKTAKIMSALNDATDQVWDDIDEGLSRKRAKAA